MMVIDASVWVSRLVARDIHHRASRDWMEGQAFQGEVLVVPILLLSEVSGAIARCTGQPELGRRAVQHLLKVPKLRIVEIDHRLGLESARLAADLLLRGADATYVAVAHRLKIPLITWDQEQLQKAEKLISVSLPLS